MSSDVSISVNIKGMAKYTKTSAELIEHGLCVIFKSVGQHNNPRANLRVHITESGGRPWQRIQSLGDL
jgi:hypothetical protein